MHVTIENDELVVRMRGLEKLWAVCSELRIPKPAITDVRWQAHANVPGREIGLRFGTGFPGVLVAGWFYSKAVGKSFLYLPRAKYHWHSLEARNVLSLKLTGEPCNAAHLAYIDESLAQHIKTWAKK